MRHWFAVGICCIGILGLQLVPMPQREQVSMLDVGQGDSILFQDGVTQVLVDGGPGAQVLQRLSEQMPWFDKKIDIVVATHFDRDHIEGLTHVLDRYDIGMVLLPRYVPTSDLGRQFLQQVIDKNIPYRFGWYGQVLSAQGMKLRTMSPIPGTEWQRLSKSKSNNASIVMRVDIGELSILLTGDAEKSIETQMLELIPPQAFDVDILKVGHHGSKTSTSAEFLSAASPSTSLISAGADNTYGHPTAEVLGRLANTSIFRTDTQGTVSFLFNGDSWRIRCGNKAHLLFAQHLCINR